MVATSTLKNTHCLTADPKLTPTPLTSFIPDGPPRATPHPSYRKDPENGWIYGTHPEATAAGMAKMERILKECRNDCFAYSMADLVGYHGSQGPMEINLTNDGSGIFSP